MMIRSRISLWYNRKYDVKFMGKTCQVLWWLNTMSVNVHAKHPHSELMIVVMGRMGTLITQALGEILMLMKLWALFSFGNECTL
jgi:hypothetical protein